MYRDNHPPHSTDSDVLAGRLRTGEAMIETETNLGRKVELERYWLQLLAEYERAVDAERRQREGQVSA